MVFAPEVALTIAAVVSESASLGKTTPVVGPETNDTVTDIESPPAVARNDSVTVGIDVEVVVSVVV
jgi:hypothetical protein